MVGSFWFCAKKAVSLFMNGFLKSVMKQKKMGDDENDAWYGQYAKYDETNAKNAKKNAAGARRTR
jgi:hypothetical protein